MSGRDLVSAWGGAELLWREEGAVPVGSAELMVGTSDGRLFSIMTRRTRRKLAWLAIIALVL